ncbi:MAG: hypothetical protein WAV09_03190 [Minisyncoccia bacterium]
MITGLRLITLALALGAVCAAEKELRRAHGEAKRLDREITHTRKLIAHATACEYYFKGKFRPRLEIFCTLVADRSWRGAVVTETATHYIATKGSAQMRIRKEGAAL